MTCIYCLVDPSGGHYPGEPRYIGKADDPEDRLRYHVHESASHQDENLHKCNWIRQLLAKGLEPELRVLQWIPDEYSETWQEAEKKWIMLFRLMGYPLTNLTDGGEGGGMLGLHHSLEARGKISKSNQGKKQSLERRQATSRRLKGNQRGRGRRGVKQGPHSEEHKKALSQSLMGHPMSQGTRLKISNSNRGQEKPPRTEEHRRHLSRAGYLAWVNRWMSQGRWVDIAGIGGWVFSVEPGV